MFSFRTTPLDEQPDLVLNRGRIGLLCNQAAWNPVTGQYRFEVWAKKGNLEKVFYPQTGFFGEYEQGVPEEVSLYQELLEPGTNVRFYALGMDPDAALFADLDALIIELQDIGARYDQTPALLYHLFASLHRANTPISIYLVDRANPSGRSVEGTPLRVKKSAPQVGQVEGLPHRHGLTLGELANLFYAELGAKFPLHIISYAASPASGVLMSWTIPPAPEVAGLFTCGFYSGMGLWAATNLSDGRGTCLPYEQVGAPYLKSLAQYNRQHKYAGWNDPNHPLYDGGVLLRWTHFTPTSGQYAGQVCYGFQWLPVPGEPFHALAHTLRMMRFFKMECEEFDLDPKGLGDQVLTDYVLNGGDWTSIREYIKVEEQKWIRKAKRYQLYEDALWRIKSLG
ncbi:MAG: DUF1343 domain-containing protein [Bacteroidales bacterium]|nr:DUF1343 domain-containing protein [Bacteroidales bacterium]